MSVIRSIWNGPFFIGKLTQPASVGDVLLKVLEVLWRCFVVISGLALSASVIVIGYSEIEPKLFPPIQDSIAAKAFYAANLPKRSIEARTLNEVENEPCEAGWPVRIVFVNNNSEPITDIRFRLEGYKEGYSNNYVEYEVDGWESDVIIPAGGAVSNCYGVRTIDGVPADALTYEVNVWDASKADQK